MMRVSETVNIGIYNTQITKTKSEEFFFFCNTDDTSNNFVVQLTNRLLVKSGNQRNFHKVFQ